MLIKKCDRCGAVYEPYNEHNNGEKTNGLMLVNIDTQQKAYFHKAKDLCPDCMNSLRTWLEEKSENE